MMRVLEKLLVWGGVSALAAFAFAYGEPQVRAAQSISNFSASKALVIETPNTALWSSARIDAYDNSADSRPAVGVLSIERLDLEAPVFIGTDDATLNAGVGWIEGTAPLQASGNIGLAAHRDSFFRSLQDVAIGDMVILQTQQGDRRYQVTGMDIIDPDETYVLEPTHRNSLTLVTCYPFYFVGNAPERFVVFATETQQL